MPDLVCDVTTKVGHSADMCLKSNDGRKIRVEVKRYTKPVPHKEVDKFFRDLKELGSSWGLLLSLNTPVSGVSSGTWIEK